MVDYGIVPTGFNRKPLAAILADLEQGAIARFGNDIVQDAQSPLGQINGLEADALDDAWQAVEDTYASFDPVYAVGPRLDLLARFQRLIRIANETDLQFQGRITNEGKADIKLVARRNELLQVPGVTYAWIIENNTAVTNALGMPRTSVAYCVQGGDDEDVALAIYEISIGGIGLFGNYVVAITDNDGYCRTVYFIRPVDVAIRVEVDVRHISDACDCSPPSVTAIEDWIIERFAGECGYKNGDLVENRRVHSETAQMGNLEIVDVRIARVDDSIMLDEIPMTIYERPVVIRPYVTARYVD